ncbi:aldose sugar dehydrogenase [Pseudomonas aeruginosa]|nr:aldose sugar dehydrogenase [Pseudomonas aeruginosa]
MPRPARTAAPERRRDVAGYRRTKRRLEGFHVIFRQLPKLSSGHHFGSRLVFDGKGHLFIALGENNQRSTSQDLDKLQGKIVRLYPDGGGSQGQSLRRPCRRAAGDLELWPPQPAGRRAESLDRPALDPRARPARRRRDQHTPGRRELRLAAGDPWNQLHPAADPRSQGQGRRRYRGAAPCLGEVAGDQRHGVLRCAALPGLAA